MKVDPQEVSRYVSNALRQGLAAKYSEDQIRDITACVQSNLVELVRQAWVDDAAIDQAIATVLRSQPLDSIISIRHALGEDHTGEASIFFRVLLSDQAKTNLRATVRFCEYGLLQRLDFSLMGLHAYFNFRTVSEQAELKDPDWEPLRIA